MEIKDRIAKLGSIFKEMQITNVDGAQIIYVVVSFPQNWIIDDDIEEKFNVTVRNNPSVPGEYYFIAEISVGETPLFDAIEYNINKMKAAIERSTLLNEKMKELRDIFEDESITIEELRTLKFDIPKGTSPIADIISQEPSGKKKGKKKE